MSQAEAKRAEIDQNLRRFLELLPEALPQHQGEYALLRHGRIVEFHETALDAQIAGNRAFDDSLFSIQHVIGTAEELGFFSHAIDPREPR